MVRVKINRTNQVLLACSRTVSARCGHFATKPTLLSIQMGEEFLDGLTRKVRQSALSTHRSQRPGLARNRGTTSHHGSARGTHLARLHLVHPPGDLRLGEHERVLLEEPDVRADALLEARELEEVDRVDGGERGVGGVGGLDARAEARGVEREHAAAGVVEDGDLARAEQPLRDDDRAQRFLAAGEVWSGHYTRARRRERKGGEEGGTHATPPALRTMCASPSWMPSSAYTLAND